MTAIMARRSGGDVQIAEAVRLAAEARYWASRFRDASARVGHAVSGSVPVVAADQTEEDGDDAGGSS